MGDPGNDSFVNMFSSLRDSGNHLVIFWLRGVVKWLTWVGLTVMKCGFGIHFCPHVLSLYSVLIRRHPGVRAPVRLHLCLPKESASPEELATLREERCLGRFL